MAKDFESIRKKVIARAWKDKRFKEKLLKDPKSAFKEMGWDMPKDMEFQIVEGKPRAQVFYLPPPPAEIHEMSQEEMEKVAGGGPTVIATTNVCHTCPQPPMTEYLTCSGGKAPPHSKCYGSC